MTIQSSTPTKAHGPVQAGPVRLKKGRDKPVRQGHPWIFSGAIAELPPPAPTVQPEIGGEGETADGQTKSEMLQNGIADGAIVDVVDSANNWLGRGYLNRKSQIQVRMLTTSPDELVPGQPEEPFWRARIQQAATLRQGLFTGQWFDDSQAQAADTPSPQSGSGALQTDAYRLINGESDGLPGLIVDWFAGYLVMEVGTLGIERRKAMLARLLAEITGAHAVIERSDTAARRQEGLDEAGGVVAGHLPPMPVAISEAGLRFEVDLLEGQKTGFYLDQRENRQRVAAYCAQARVLNAFAYTGAFAVHALARGATHVTNIDTSGDALQQADRNLACNGFDPQTQSRNITGDVFQVLRAWRREEHAPFDVIILDPPKFAQSRRNVDKALRGYKDINLLAMQLLRPGGILATFSCSGLVDADLFQKVVFGAAVDAGRHVRVLEWLRQAPDHAVGLHFPEGEYLKGLICYVA